jgi:hypothetical protein
VNPTWAMRTAIKKARSSPSERAVFFTLLDEADKDTGIIPDGRQPNSLADLAESCGMSLPTLKRVLLRLKQNGWLTSIRGGGPGNPTRYQLHIGEPFRAKRQRPRTDAERQRKSRSKRTSAVTLDEPLAQGQSPADVTIPCATFQGQEAEKVVNPSVTTCRSEPCFPSRGSDVSRQVPTEVPPAAMAKDAPPLQRVEAQPSPPSGPIDAKPSGSDGSVKGLREATPKAPLTGSRYRAQSGNRAGGRPAVDALEVLRKQPSSLRSEGYEDAVRLIRDTLGAQVIPAKDVGPCAVCRGPCRRYGPLGNPLCDDCRAALEERRRAAQPERGPYLDVVDGKNHESEVPR